MAVLINATRSDAGSVNVNVVSCAQVAARKAIADGATLTITAVSSSPLGGRRQTTIQSKLSSSDRRNSSDVPIVQAGLFAEAMAGIRAILQGPAPPDPNDVFDATTVIAGVLEQQAGPRTLVICGDVNEVAPGFNAYADNLTPARSRALLKHLGPALPDLSSIDVAFGAVGLDAPVGSNTSSFARAAIARWWTKFWTPAVHARSVTYGPELRLI